MADERWYVAMTEPNAERLAKKHLSTLAFPALLPECRQAQRRGRAVQYRTGPLFPGYIFVRFDRAVAPWGAICQLPGILRSVGVLRIDNKPLPVPDAVIADIEARLAASDGVIDLTVPDELVDYAPNQPLRVTDGPLQGLVGLYVACASERVTLMLDMLGGSVAVHLPQRSVAAV